MVAARQRLQGNQVRVVAAAAPRFRTQPRRPPGSRGAIRRSQPSDGPVEPVAELDVAAASAGGPRLEVKAVTRRPDAVRCSPAVPGRGTAQLARRQWRKSTGSKGQRHAARLGPPAREPARGPAAPAASRRRAPAGWCRHASGSRGRAGDARARSSPPSSPRRRRCGGVGDQRPRSPRSTSSAISAAKPDVLDACSALFAGAQSLHSGTVGAPRSRLTRRSAPVPRARRRSVSD